MRLWGALLCWLGRHDRQMQAFTERVILRRSDGTQAEHTHQLHKYSCVQCDPAVDIVSEFPFTPAAVHQEGR